MGKIQQLKGVAHNLADSFLSPTNSHFLYEISYLKNPIELEIDLISGNVKPEEVKSENLGETVEHYKNWFYNQSNKIGISANKVSQVVIFFSCKPGKNFGFYLHARVKITVEGKEYSAVSKSGYS